MGLTLGILAEATSHYDKKKNEYITYCDMNQYVSMEIGLERCTPMGKIVIELDHTNNKVFAEMFLALARGEYVHQKYGSQLRYTNTPLHYISSTKNIIMGGDVLNGNGSGGCAPTSTGVVEHSYGVSVVESTRGCVVLLPSDSNPRQFNSLFYIMLEKSSTKTIIDGIVVGKVVEGLNVLDSIVHDYGTAHGIPQKNVLIHQCEHV